MERAEKKRFADQEKDAKRQADDDERERKRSQAEKEKQKLKKEQEEAERQRLKDEAAADKDRKAERERNRKQKEETTRKRREAQQAQEQADADTRRLADAKTAELKRLEDEEREKIEAEKNKQSKLEKEERKRKLDEKQKEAKRIQDEKDRNANASQAELKRIQDEKDRDSKARVQIKAKKTREIRRDALVVIPLLENKKFAKKAWTYFDIDTEASLIPSEVLEMLEIIVEEFREKVVKKTTIPTPVGFNYSLIKNQLLECIDSNPSMDLKLFELTMYDSNPFGMVDENLEQLERAGILREQLTTRFFAENAYDTLAEDAFNANGEDPFTKKTLVRELENLNMNGLAEKVREEHGEPDINFHEFYKVIYDEVHPGDMDAQKENRITEVDGEEEGRI